MVRTVWFIALMLVGLPLVGWSQSTDQFTPVVVSPLLHKTERVLGLTVGTMSSTSWSSPAPAK